MLRPLAKPEPFGRSCPLSRRHAFWTSLVVVLLLGALAGCGDDDDDGNGDDAERKAKPVAGTFVGKAQGSDAFVAVVAAPPAKGQDKREVTVFVCDAKRLCQSFSGSASGNDFRVQAEVGDARATLTAKAATGRVDLPDAGTVRYKAATATATAGVYDLTVSANGRIRGASAAGVGLKGQSTLPEPGNGTIKLADGRRLKFEVTRNSSDDPISLKPGEMRLIVLQDGQLKGAAKSRPAEGGEASDFYVLSAPK
jgi:hypothetical protein